MATRLVPKCRDTYLATITNHKAYLRPAQVATIRKEKQWSQTTLELQLITHAKKTANPVISAYKVAVLIQYQSSDGPVYVWGGNIESLSSKKFTIHAEQAATIIFLNTVRDHKDSFPKNIRLQTPLQLAEENRQIEIVELIKAHQATVTQKIILGR